MAGFKTQWTTSAPGETITLPLFDSGVFNCTVDWGDGGATSAITAWDDVDKTHTYVAAGTYDVEITGECPAWLFNNAGDKLKIVDILDWGDSADFGGFSYLYGGFYGCTNLKSCGPVGSKILAKAGLNSLFRLFSLCSNASFTVINPGLFDNCANVTNMSEMYYGCTNLISIPSGLFDFCSSNLTFAFCFGLCTSLASIPANLFRLNLSVTSFSYCLYLCSKLQLNKNTFYADGEQSTRFLNKTVTFTNCFNRTSFTGVQGEAPDLWNCNFGTGSANPTSCFSGAGNTAASISNYADIPVPWGGPYGGLLDSTAKGDILTRLVEEGSLRLYHDYRSGRTFDFSGQGNSGVASAGAVFTKRGAKFNATTDEVTVTDSASLRVGSGTIFVLGDFVSQETNEGLVGRSNGSTCLFWFYYDAAFIRFNDNVNLRSRSATVVGKKSLAITWTSGGTPVGYADGISLGNFSGTSTPAVTAGTVLEIGNVLNNNRNRSQIRAVVICARALTESEVARLHAQLENTTWPIKNLPPGALMP